MKSDDTRLVEEARDGDMAAFEQLVHKHDKRVLAIAARYVTSAEDAKDIYQEVFIRVYRGMKQFNMQSEFSTWLHRITVNVCLSHKSQKRKNHVPLDGDGHKGDPYGEALRSSGEGTDQLSMNTEIRQHVQTALNQLSPKQRMVFTLKHYEGYKLREIAAMMKCKEGTVKRYLFLATQQLRERLRVVYE